MAERTSKRAHNFFSSTTRIAFGVCCVEIALLPIFFSQRPLEELSTVIGPERWFAQGRYVRDLIDNGYDRTTVMIFSNMLNIFVSSCLIYITLRIISAIFDPCPSAIFGKFYTSVIHILILLFFASRGINHARMMYDVSTIKSLAVDETVILAIYFGLAFYFGVVAAQIIGFAKLEYADRWSV